MNALSWMKDSVFYQIYPQSFQDDNGDGIGDIPGIIRRLDHIEKLGANTLWLNPCFDSPFGDAGYDVRDFYKIAPRYGTEADLVALFDEAHKRGMRVVLDLVAGHTSMDNPWFVAEAQDPKSSESNRYVWKNREFDPANGPDKEDFVSNFFWFQPALNFGYSPVTEPWQDPVDAPGPKKNREELKRILSYWFDRGCDGFRVDMAPSLIKGEERDAAVILLWQDIRAWLDLKYPHCALVAEWTHPSVAISAGFHLDFMMHCGVPGYPQLFFNGSGTMGASPCYFSPEGDGELKVFQEEYARQLAAIRGKGFVSLPSANHDFQRLRVGERTTSELRTAWVFLMTQVGVPIIYYGDEIGMRFVPNTPGKEGSTLWKSDAPDAGDIENGERAGTRTPMQWDDSDNGGFSTADPECLYLPMDPDPERPTVAAQESDPDSLFHFVQMLLRLRREHPTLRTEADYVILNPENQPYPMVIKRSLGNQSTLIVVNPSRQKQSLEIDSGFEPTGTLLESGVEWCSATNGILLTVKPSGYAILELKA